MSTHPTDPDRIAELEAHNAALASANRDLETFVYAISHDIAAPLRAIDGFSRLLVEDAGKSLSPEALRDLTGIRSGVERMQELLSSWLRIARCDRAPLQRPRIDLSALARVIVHELQQVESDHAPQVSVAPDLSVSADPVLARELLHNLIANAWKFSRCRGAAARIAIGAEPRGGELVYYVSDNGVGFDPHEAQGLFRPFQRLATAVRFSGMGVGLAIAQRIVERHGGSIWAEGALDRGARFHFTLPTGSMNSRECDSPTQPLGPAAACSSRNGHEHRGPNR